MEVERRPETSRDCGSSAWRVRRTKSALRVRAQRLPWLLGRSAGRAGAVMVLRTSSRACTRSVALAFYIHDDDGAGRQRRHPDLVRGRARAGHRRTGPVQDRPAPGRELMTAGLVGLSVSASLVGLSYLISGTSTCPPVLGVAMLLVVADGGHGRCTGIPPGAQQTRVDPPWPPVRFITTRRTTLSGAGISWGWRSLMLSSAAGVTLGVVSGRRRPPTALVLRACPCGETSAVRLAADA